MGAGAFLIIVVLLILLWTFGVLPMRRRQRAQTEAHEAMQDSLVVGDEIITAGGLHATVRELEDESVRIEIAPGVIATLDRRAVAAVATDVEDDGDGEEEPPAEPEVDPKPR